MFVMVVECYWSYYLKFVKSKNAWVWLKKFLCQQDETCVVIYWYVSNEWCMDYTLKLVKFRYGSVSWERFCGVAWSNG